MEGTIGNNRYQEFLENRDAQAAQAAELNRIAAAEEEQ
jgi:hypothetical protein